MAIRISEHVEICMYVHMYACESHEIPHKHTHAVCLYVCMHVTVSYLVCSIPQFSNSCSSGLGKVAQLEGRGGVTHGGDSSL